MSRLLKSGLFRPLCTNIRENTTNVARLEGGSNLRIGSFIFSIQLIPIDVYTERDYNCCSLCGKKRHTFHEQESKAYNPLTVEISFTVIS